MIDLHAHVLPGVDDGPCDDRAALDLLRDLEAEGVTEVVATPHTLDGRFDVSRARMLEGVGRLQERAIEAGLGIQIHPGAEVMVQADLPEILRRGEVSTLADTGRYLLVETSFQVVPPEIDRLFFELQLEGVVPVLAHPERTLPVQKHPDRLIPLIEAGILVQLDASSLTGHFGREARRAAILLLDRGLAHLVASDAHDHRLRPPRLQAAYWAVESRCGTEVARAMMQERPAQILRGDTVEVSWPAHAATARGATRHPTSHFTRHTRKHSWWRRMLLGE
jgi:protein-tyrosine phosphatase